MYIELENFENIEISKSKRILKFTEENFKLCLSLFENNPNIFFNKKLSLIHNINEKQSYYLGDKGHSIYLNFEIKLEKIKNFLSHELVHPFIRACNIHNINQDWGEGFCDFIKVLIQQKNNMDDYRKIFKEYINAVNINKKSKYTNPAGQLLLKMIYDKNCIIEKTNLEELLSFFEKNINEEDFKKIINFYKENKCIESLDFSWSKK